MQNWRRAERRSQPLLSHPVSMPPSYRPLGMASHKVFALTSGCVEATPRLWAGPARRCLGSLPPYRRRTNWVAISGRIRHLSGHACRDRDHGIEAGPRRPSLGCTMIFPILLVLFVVRKALQACRSPCTLPLQLCSHCDMIC